MEVDTRLCKQVLDLKEKGASVLGSIPYERDQLKVYESKCYGLQLVNATQRKKEDEMKRRNKRNNNREERNLKLR